MGGGGATNVNQVTNLIPSWAQTQVTSYLVRANALSNTAWLSYSALTYATQNVNETDGIAAIALRGRNGDATIALGRTVLNNDLNGVNLSNNPMLDNAYLKKIEVLVQEFNEVTLPNAHWVYNRMGRYGGGSHALMERRLAEDMISKFIQTASEVYESNYFAERGYQEAAIRNAISFAQESLKDPEILRKAGLLAREYTQGQYIDAYHRYVDANDAAIKRLNILGNAIRALVGATVTDSTPYYLASPINQIAGLAMVGLGLFGGQGQQGYQKSGGALDTIQSAVNPSTPATSPYARPSISGLNSSSSAPYSQMTIGGM